MYIYNIKWNQPLHSVVVITVRTILWCGSNYLSVLIFFEWSHAFETLLHLNKEAEANFTLPWMWKS